MKHKTHKTAVTIQSLLKKKAPALDQSARPDKVLLQQSSCFSVGKVFDALAYIRES